MFVTVPPIERHVPLIEKQPPVRFIPFLAVEVAVVEVAVK